MISAVLVVVCAIVSLIYYIHTKLKWENAPPGPKGLPILGNIFQMKKIVHLVHVEWAKKYGPIFQYNLLGQRVVVISDHKLLREIYNETVFSGRINLAPFDLSNDGTVHGVVSSTGERWEQMRRFTLRQLRDFGFGKKSMEELILVEVSELIENMKEHNGQSVTEVKEKLLIAVVNSLWAITTGSRFSQKDNRLIEMTTKATKSQNEVVENGSLVIIAPRLSKLFPKWTGYTQLRNNLEEFADYFRKSIKEHFDTYSPDYARDFTDIFIKEIKEAKPGSEFYGETGEKNLLGTLNDLYQAGTDTTSTTLSWMILYLSKFPRVQKKFQEEIERTTGNSRLCSVADRPVMPYTEAVIAETLRFSSIAPQGVPHYSTAGKEFKGYWIPKGTGIVANEYFIHFDPKIWGDPEIFRPDRFLSEDGSCFKKHEALIPFSVGRRQCLGETLARDSLFLFATNLFQRFEFEFDTNGPDNGFESPVSFILFPKPYNVIIKDRLS